MSFSIRDIVVSTVAFFVAAYFIKRWAEDMDLPKGMVRNATVFALALAASYVVQVAVDWIARVV
ncbi:MAG: hypothetical protein M0015_10040 [Betaproteobacteria bacterium]|nr:hypothetical protein [Betaproteobacteria bacterium]